MFDCSFGWFGLVVKWLTIYNFGFSETFACQSMLEREGVGERGRDETIAVSKGRATLTFCGWFLRETDVFQDVDQSDVFQDGDQFRLRCVLYVLHCSLSGALPVCKFKLSISVHLVRLLLVCGKIFLWSLYGL